uniref:Uncharacterized protein n=1 Tax=Arundo donax TaxID=35708 RepID=A0A0A9GR23_ARUDO
MPHQACTIVRAFALRANYSAKLNLKGPTWLSVCSAVMSSKWQFAHHFL